MSEKLSTLQHSEFIKGSGCSITQKTERKQIIPDIELRGTRIMRHLKSLKTNLKCETMSDAKRWYIIYLCAFELDSSDQITSRKQK